MTTLAIPAPSSLPDVYTLCEQIQRDMVQINDVGTLKEAAVKLGAIDQYLSRTSTEGRKQVQETMRRLEARCGWLLGEAQPGGGNHGNQHTRPSTANDGLTKDERHDFRALAANPEIVDEIIAKSTDEAPPSRSKILDAIKTSALSKLLADDEDLKLTSWRLQFSKALKSGYAPMEFGIDHVSEKADEELIELLERLALNMGDFAARCRKQWATNHPGGLRLVREA